jgi:YtxH-like protein
MRIRNRKALLSMLMGTGLYLLDPLRNRIADRLDDLADRAQDTYDTASDRLGRATRVVRGDDHRFISSTGAMLLGMGIGVGLGLLFAPASGQETRSNLSNKVHDFGDRVRERVNKPETATGSY